MTRTIWVRTSLFAVATVAAMTAIGACSSGKSSSGEKANLGGLSPVPSQPGVVSRDALGSVSGSGGSGSATGAQHSANGSKSTPLGPTKIRTAEITLEVKKPGDVALQADRAGAIALRYGGEVYGDDRTGGKDASAVVVLKVPPNDLTNVLKELAKLGVEKARSESTKDVTSEKADVNTRVDNLNNEITKLNHLLDPTTQKLTDVLELEQTISDRTADLESLQAQKRALDAQTDTATITVSLSTAAVLTHHHKKAGGFIGGLRDGWHAFVTGATWCAKALGAILPFAVLLVLVGIGLRLAWPKLGLSRRVRPEPTPATE